jgi:sugar transferase (PEP-CTERM/EpsH1 system associated)
MARGSGVTRSAVTGHGDVAGTGAQARATGPVRVMHVVYTLRTGGMEMGVVKLVNGLDPALVRSSICSTTPAGEIKALVQPSVPVFELSRRAGNDLRIVAALYRVFRRERPHVVHTHAWGTLFEGLVAARAAGVPVVVHGEHGTLQLRAHQRWLQRMGWTAADRVLSVSSVLAERMSATTGFPARRITTIRNGVNLERFHVARHDGARAALGLPQEARIVGTVGRLVAVKDQVTLVDAVAELGRSGVAATLVIAGDGPERGRIEARAAERGVDLRLLGYRPDVEQVLAALDVFVLSSISEGLSNTILEAMAAARPVVATRVGGAEEMIADGVTGILVPPSDAATMGAALRRVLAADDSGAGMGAAARQRVETEFTLTGMMQRYERMYTEVARSKGVVSDTSPVQPLPRSGVA